MKFLKFAALFSVTLSNESFRELYHMFTTDLHLLFLLFSYSRLLANYQSIITKFSFSLVVHRQVNTALGQTTVQWQPNYAS